MAPDRVCECAGVSPDQIKGLGFAATCSLVAVDGTGQPVSTSPSRGIQCTYSSVWPYVMWLLALHHVTSGLISWSYIMWHLVLHHVTSWSYIMWHLVLHHMTSGFASCDFVGFDWRENWHGIQVISYFSHILPQALNIMPSSGRATGLSRKQMRLTNLITQFSAMWAGFYLQRCSHWNSDRKSVV